MILQILICATVSLLLNVNVSGADVPDPQIPLPDGIIQGRILTSAKGNSYYAYQQIPYASPPIGNLRFKEPQAPTSWKDVLKTTSNTVICYQGGKVDQIPEGVEENEDCLYLNVYTPQGPGNTTTDLPVMVWIHGGDFYYGDGTFQNYGPQFIIDYGVIVVTFNYRLGPFGFLTTADGVIPGNIGLKDQNFALQWVQKNIHLFGGNSKEVTIVGQNSGGISVGYHLLSEKSSGLFRGAIMQSGTVLSANGYQANAKYFAFEMGRSLDKKFASANSSDLLELLQNASSEDINNAKVDIPEDKQVGLGIKELIWLPMIENANFSGVVITSPMHDSMESGLIANNVPILLGFNSEEEMTFVGDGENLRKFGQECDRNFSRLINNKFNMTNNKNIPGRGLRQIYTNSVFQTDLTALIRFMSDEGYTTPIIRHAELQAKYSKVYLYQLSYKGILGGLMIKPLAGADTVGHGEDLNYLWYNSKSPAATLSVSNKVTQHRIIQLWTNFVKYLNPTPKDKTNNPLGITWTPVNSTSINYLNIDTNLEIKSGPRVYEQVKEIIDRYATPPLVTY